MNAANAHVRPWLAPLAHPPEPMPAELRGAFAPLAAVAPLAAGLRGPPVPLAAPKAPMRWLRARAAAQASTRYRKLELAIETYNTSLHPPIRTSRDAYLQKVEALFWQGVCRKYHRCSLALRVVGE